MVCPDSLEWVHDNHVVGSSPTWANFLYGVGKPLAQYEYHIYIYMSPGKDETRVCGYIRSEFIH